MKIHLIIFTLLYFTECVHNSSIHNFTITKYVKVYQSYNYSNDILNYKFNKYKPLVSTAYCNDTISSISVFKPEGRVHYSKDELSSDTLFLNLLSIPNLVKLELQCDSIMDNNIVRLIDNKENVNIFCIDKDTLYLYNTKMN